MKQVKRLLVSMLALSLILGIPAHAAPKEETATLSYNNIQIVLDDVSIIPCDANGNYVEPFIIDGTTYLPVRAIGNAMGLSANWNPDTNTVALTSGGQKVNGTSTGNTPSGYREVTKTLTYNDIKITVDGREIIPMANGSPVEPFIIEGTTYLPVRGIASALGLNVSWDGATNTAILTTYDYGAEQSGASNVPGVPDGWLPYSTGSLENLLKAIADGYVIYENGSYWCSPEYASMMGNENVVYFEDVAGDKDEGGTLPSGNLLEDGIDYIELVGINALASIRNKLVSEELYAAVASGKNPTNISVSDIDVLQYCMPSLPDNFIENPVSGTYDGIRVFVENGEILMAEEDLINAGFID